MVQTAAARRNAQGHPVGLTDWIHPLRAKPRAKPGSPTDQTARADVQCRRRLQLVRIIEDSERQHRDAISELFVNVKYPCAAPRRAAAAVGVSARRFRPWRLLPQVRCD